MGGTNNGERKGSWHSRHDSGVMRRTSSLERLWKLASSVRTCGPDQMMRDLGTVKQRIQVWDDQGIDDIVTPPISLALHKLKLSSQHQDARM